MHQGFEFNKDFKPSGTEFQPKGFPQGHKSYGSNAEHKHVYNFKAPPFEEPSEGFQIPSQILDLFVENKDKASHENKNKVGSRTSITSHSTVDSSRNPNGMNFGQHNAGAAHNMHGGNNGMKFPSFNSLLSQSNDFMMMKNNAPNDLNTSKISNNDSRNISMNNVSRNSGDLNMSNSRRNTSSRAGPKANKNYQVTLNDDVSLIERIEIMLNQITMNHNKSCPFCSKTIDIKKCNFQNISALLSNTSKKYYLTHFDCYLKSNSNPASAKIVSLASVVEAKVNSQINSLSSIDTSNFLRSDRKAYFVSLEGYHPVSSYLLFRIDKICHGLEHASHRNQLLYMNLSNKTTSIFEPTSYNIPFSEFRLCITVHMSHANEDPFYYEYLVDFSQVKLSAEQKNKFAEVACVQEGNNMTIGTQIVYDPAVDLAPKSMANLDSSFQSTSSSTSAKPDFGKNVYVTFKHFTMNLPLKRVERKTKEAQLAPVVEESPFDQSHKSAAAQKKPHARLQLNPHAPLFSNANGQPEQPGVQQQQQQQQPVPQQQPQQPPFVPSTASQVSAPAGFNSQGNFGGQPFPGNKQQGQDSSSNAFQAFNPANPATFFNNAGGFPQGLQSEQPGPQQFNFPNSFSRPQGQSQQPQSFHQTDMMPPGLGLVVQPQNAMNFPGYSPQQMFQNQQGSDLNQRRGQPQGFQGFQNIPSSMEGHNEGHGYTDNQHQGEQRHYQEEGGQPEGVNYPSEANYENYKPNKEGQPTMDRGRNRPSSLYTSVLSGKKRENSLSNSPSLHNMQNRYFSAASTPGSNYGQVDSPLSQSNNDFFGNEEPSNPPLSEDMIENFRLEDHLGELVEFAKSYNGSRILQKFFPKANQNEVELVIGEIQGNLEELMLDPYANYMFQTLAQSCSADQRYFLLQKVAPSMVELASDRKGTHSLQSLIALVSRDVEEKLLRDTLQSHVVELSFDPQGTHLVQKLIVSISINNIDFIFEPLVQRFVEVANHSFGLCVLKQLITKVEKVPELRRRIIRLLYDNLENLIQNPYGNYALQHSLDTFQGDCNAVFEKTFDRIVQYSNQKFSSNVIEKCLLVAAPEFKKRFIKELIRNDRITELMKNKYGNFVLLKALKSVDTEDRQLIMQSIQRNLNSVSMAKYKNSWTKFIEENPLRVPSMSTNKPSLFRNNSQNSENMGAERLDQSSPKQLSPWNDSKRDQQAKGAKDDKSQFYYESGKEGSYAGGEAEIKNLGLNQPELGGGEDDRENRGLRENFGGMGGQQMAKKGKQTGNQKFYDDKGQHYAAANKWGFNNFY